MTDPRKRQRIPRLADRDAPPHAPPQIEPPPRPEWPIGDLLICTVALAIAVAALFNAYS